MINYVERIENKKKIMSNTICEFSRNLFLIVKNQNKLRRAILDKEEESRQKLSQNLSEYEKSSETIQEMIKKYKLAQIKHKEEFLKEKEFLLKNENLLLSDFNISKALLENEQEIVLVENYEQLIFSYVEDLNYSKLELIYNLILMN